MQGKCTFAFAPNTIQSDDIIQNCTIVDKTLICSGNVLFYSFFYINHCENDHVQLWSTRDRHCWCIVSTTRRSSRDLVSAIRRRFQCCDADVTAWSHRRCTKFFHITLDRDVHFRFMSLSLVRMATMAFGSHVFLCMLWFNDRLPVVSACRLLSILCTVHSDVLSPVSATRVRWPTFECTIIDSSILTAAAVGQFLERTVLALYRWDT